MGLLSTALDWTGDRVRDTASVLTLGAVDSSSEVAQKRQNRKQQTQTRAMQKGLDQMVANSDARDKQQDMAIEKNRIDALKSAKALEQDVGRLQKRDRAQDLKLASAMAGHRRLAKHVERLQRANKQQIRAIEMGQQAEDRAAARAMASLQRVLGKIPGGSMMQGLLSKVLKDGYLDDREHAVLTSASAMLTLNLHREQGEEIATIRGDIAEVHGTLSAHSIRMRGIGSNARAHAALTTALTNLGITTTGDWKEDLANGVFFFRGRRIDIQTIILSEVLAKAKRVYLINKKEESDGIKGFFALETDAPAVLIDARQNRKVDDGASAQMQDGDLYCEFVDGGELKMVSRDDIAREGGTSWPMGSIVRVGGEARLAGTLPSMVKVSLATAAMSFDKWYTTLAPLISETLTNKFGFEDGFDFGMN